MKQHLDPSRIVHEIREFQKWLSRKYPDLNETMSKKSEQEILHQIRWILSKYVHPQSSISQPQLAQVLLKEVPAYLGQKVSYYTKFAENLVAETACLPYEESGFQTLKVQSFKAWYSLIQEHALQTYSAFVLLGCFICESRDQLINRYLIGELSGFDLEVVDKQLKELSQLGLIKLVGKNTGHPKQYSIVDAYIIKQEPDGCIIYNKWDHDFCDPSNALFAELNLLQDVSEIDFVTHLVTNRVPKANPLIYRTGQAEIHAHKQLMKPLVIAASLLSAEQILNWLSKAYTAKPGRVLNRLKKELELFIQTLYYRSSHPEKHYEQILQVMPLLHYVARRQFNVDLDYQGKLVACTIQMRMDKIHHTFVQTQNFTNPKGGWDVGFFLNCLTFQDPTSKWSEKYPDKEIIFQNSLTSTGVSPRIVLKPGQWSIADLECLPGSLPGIAELNCFLKANRELNQLIQYMNRLVVHGFTSFQFHPKVLSVKTHRIYFVDPSSQNIPKSLRPIFRAQANHHLLMIDMSEMELSIIKHYASKYALKADGIDLSKLTFDSLSQDTGLLRKKIKTFIYSYMYGASMDTIQDEVGLSEAEISVIEYALKRYPQVAEFRKDISNRTRTKGFSPPTPLGFSIPVIKSKSYAGFSYLIQSTGAEIFRQWILELHEMGLSKFLINAIHDELLFEVPKSTNVYDFRSQVEVALHQATQTILPQCQLSIKAKAGKCWDEKTAIDISIPLA